MSEHWIATIGAPRGHRLRFLYSGAGANYARTVECECGWRLTYREDKPRSSAIAAHARHVDLVRAKAWPDPTTRESVELLTRGDAAAAAAGPERFDGAPHPAELESEDP